MAILFDVIAGSDRARQCEAHERLVLMPDEVDRWFVLFGLQSHFGDTAPTRSCFVIEYFGGTEGNLVGYLLKFILLGEGDTAPVTH